MKVSLINPPIEDFYITSVRRQPLGLLYLASLLKGYGHEVELINCHTPKKHIVQLPSKFSYLNAFKNRKEDLYKFPFGEYQRFGMSSEAIDLNIKKSKADLFLISSLFTTYYEEVEDIITVVRKYHPESLIVAGGYHPSLFPEQFIRRTEVDAVIVGEGELGIIKLIELINNGTFKNGMIIKTGEFITNLNELPFPDRALLKDRDFNFYRKKGTAIIASRGCPNKCSFCTSRMFWNGNYNFRSLDNVIKEIDDCVKKYGVTQFNFEDDNLFTDKKRAIMFLNSVKMYQEKNKIKLDLSAMNGVSIENIDKEVIGLMYRSGFSELNISLVTSSVKQQKRLDRPFNTLKFSEIATAGKKAGMNIRAYYILGLPNQEKSEVLDTINYLKDLNVQAFPSVYYNITENVAEWKVQRSSAFFNETKYLSRADLIYLFNYNYQKCL